MVVIVTYDEFGGYWDHVPPPAGAGGAIAGGRGRACPRSSSRPLQRRGFIDKTVYDTTSIHKLVNRRFGLTPCQAYARMWAI